MTGIPSRNEAGFTLVELAVAVVLTALILATALSTTFNMQSSWDQSQDRVQVTQNSRAALEMMARDLRMAGSGFAGRTLTTGGVPSRRMFPLQPRSGGAFGTDTLVVVGGSSGVSTGTAAIMQSPSDLLFVNDASGFEVGDLVVITDGGDANLFEVTSKVPSVNRLDHASTSPYNTPADHDTWPAGGYPTGSTVVKVERLTYWVDDTGPTAKLYRQTHHGDPVPIAQGVASLLIRYVLADGSVVADPADPSLIRSVRIEYVGRSSRPTHADTLRISTMPRVMG